ncbi:MAG: hypothetical protein QW292_03920 [Candidatus Parvarchaeota archaeon]
MLTNIDRINMDFRPEASDTHQFMLNITEDGQSQALVYSWLSNDENEFAFRLTLQMGRRIPSNLRVKVYHTVYPFKLTSKYIRRYSFWQGMAEAHYDDLFGHELRKKSRRGFISRVILDLTKSDVSHLPKRAQSLFNFLLFGYLGFLAYRNKHLFQCINHHL